MSERDDGGPAFPTGFSEGISKRDYFAGQAEIREDILQDQLDAMGYPKPLLAKYLQMRAMLRYLDADAMLAERSKGEQT